MSDLSQLAQRFPPSEYLQDEIIERGWTEDDLAQRMGIAPSQAVALLGGNLTVDADIAAALAKALGTSATVWLRLQERHTPRDTDPRSASLGVRSRRSCVTGARQ